MEGPLLSNFPPSFHDLAELREIAGLADVLPFEELSQVAPHHPPQPSHFTPCTALAPLAQQSLQPAQPATSPVNQLQHFQQQLQSPPWVMPFAPPQILAAPLPPPPSSLGLLPSSLPMPPFTPFPPIQPVPPLNPTQLPQRVPTLPKLPLTQSFAQEELRLENESEIHRLLAGNFLTASGTNLATMTATRSCRAVRKHNACIERVIDPEQEEDEVDLEVALSYGSRQGIALDKPNKRRRRGDDPLAAESHRLEKNRQSARECRLRKKAYIRGLETQSRRLSDKVKQQDEEIASLRANLKAVYDKYQALAAKALSA
eukprot:m.217521 g.217521  ORF g.217521 m.217521 type:complete len:315 (+) comp10787_c0_seq5:439-1383(+)